MPRNSTSSNFNSNNKNNDNKKKISARTYFSKRIFEISHGTLEKRSDCSLNLTFKRKFNRNHPIKLFNYNREIVLTFQYTLTKATPKQSFFQREFKISCAHMHTSKHGMPDPKFETMNGRQTENFQSVLKTLLIPRTPCSLNFNKRNLKTLFQVNFNNTLQQKQNPIAIFKEKI